MPQHRAVATITLDELAAALRPSPSSLLTPALRLHDLCELASEEDPRGPLATVHALLEGLRIKRADDDATCAVLAAIQYLHLPALLDDQR